MLGFSSDTFVLQFCIYLVWFFQHVSISFDFYPEMQSQRVSSARAPATDSDTGDTGDTGTWKRRRRNQKLRSQVIRHMWHMVHVTGRIWIKFFPGAFIKQPGFNTPFKKKGSSIDSVRGIPSFSLKIHDGCLFASAPVQFMSALAMLNWIFLYFRCLFIFSTKPGGLRLVMNSRRCLANRVGNVHGAEFARVGGELREMSHFFTICPFFLKGRYLSCIHFVFSLFFF